MNARKEIEVTVGNQSEVTPDTETPTEQVQLANEWNEYLKQYGTARKARRAMDKAYGKKSFTLGSYKFGK